VAWFWLPRRRAWSEGELAPPEPFRFTARIEGAEPLPTAADIVAGEVRLPDWCRPDASRPPHAARSDRRDRDPPGAILHREDRWPSPRRSRMSRLGDRKGPSADQ
jgi:hypothetical protein